MLDSSPYRQIVPELNMSEYVVISGMPLNHSPFHGPIRYLSTSPSKRTFSGTHLVSVVYRYLHGDGSLAERHDERPTSFFFPIFMPGSKVFRVLERLPQDGAAARVTQND